MTSVSLSYRKGKIKLAQLSESIMEIVNYFALPWLATASICFLSSSSSIK